MDLEEKIKNCLERHPDWDDKRVCNTTGARKADLEAVKRGEPVPQPKITMHYDDGTAEVIAPAVTPACISLSAVRDKLDVAAMIRREVNRIPRGQLMPEDDLCRLTAGRDRNRFRRAVENNADGFRAHRVRLRLDESTDGKWYWGQAPDVAEALKIRDL